MVLALVVAVTVGCGPRGDGDPEGALAAAETEDASTTVSPGGSAGPQDKGPPAGGELPLDWTTGVLNEISEKQTALYFGFVKRCMAEAGFEVELPPGAATPPGWREEDWREVTRYPIRYGVVTEVQARLAGYDDPEEALGDLPEEEEAEEELLPEDPAERAAFQAAWFGPESAPVDLDDLVVIRDPITGEPVVALESFDARGVFGSGCKGRANEWLAGDFVELSEEPSVFLDPEVLSAWMSSTTRRTFDEALGEERVAAVAAEWRRCMAERGYELPEFRYPGGLMAPDVTQAEWARHRDARELWTVEVAVDDVACQQEVDWLGRLRRVEAGFQQEVVERAPELFAEAREILEAYRARLAELSLEEAPVGVESS